MTKDEKIKKTIIQALNEVVVPVLEKIDEKTDRMENNIENLHGKFDSQQNRLDRHGVMIEKIQRKISLHV